MGETSVRHLLVTSSFQRAAKRAAKQHPELSAAIKETLETRSAHVLRHKSPRRQPAGCRDPSGKTSIRAKPPPMPAHAASVLTHKKPPAAAGGMPRSKRKNIDPRETATHTEAPPLLC